MEVAPWSTLIDSEYRCGAKTIDGSSVKPGGGSVSLPNPDHRTLGSKKTMRGCARPASPSPARIASIARA